ncbi:hypothetical protein HNQ96_000748 [Aminobacter lissarensis]|uniref:Uncharacterized protein n=1 Tax=Aminobacter carboxidus TaxID=376165 RepID=A0A8E2B9W6_9HYPH|nr:hypothetical protein [Aminobacter lissarensis]MBB6464901.1 hypothetical protein [Aminobacter lissarensis]
MKAFRAAVLAVLQFAVILFPLAGPAFSKSDVIQPTAHTEGVGAAHGHSHDEDQSSGKESSHTQHFADHSHETPSAIAILPFFGIYQPRAWQVIEQPTIDLELRLKIKRPPRHLSLS